MTNIEYKFKQEHKVNLSPCISKCCLNEKDICLGCFRHLNEITGWRALTETEQQNVLTKCKQRKNMSNQ